MEVEDAYKSAVNILYPCEAVNHAYSRILAHTQHILYLFTYKEVDNDLKKLVATISPSTF